MTTTSSAPHTLLQAIATELAFVEVTPESSLRQIAAAVAELAKLAGSRASSELTGSLNWFGNALEGELRTTSELNGATVQQLHQWYECLEVALQGWQAPGGAEAAAAEPPLKLNVEEDADLLHEFCNEGRELLQNIEEGVLVLEDNPGHMDTLNLVFRAFHTFKGGAGFLALDPIKNLAHELESLLDAARRSSLQIDRRMIELILAGGDTLRQFVTQISEHLAAGRNADMAPIATAELIARVQACLKGEPDPFASASGDLLPPTATPPAALAPMQAPAADPATPADGGELVRPEASPAAPPATAAPGHALSAGEELSSGPVISPRLHTPASAPMALEQAPAAAKPAKVKAAEHLPSYVRLDTEKIDALVDLVGELLIAQSMVVQHPQVLKLADRDLSRHLRQLARITSDLQRNAMSLRMVPIRGAFQKMNRLVRDLAHGLGKQVQLELVGEDIELDRNIVEQLGDPLVHMVRNSLDHGIEMPDDRAAQGKPEQGTIRLEALHQGGGIVIRISDDGKGMDPDRILAKAMERGLVGPGFSGADKDIFDLIFMPGFSTAESVTDISGRGVGMDVVRTTIARLRGRVEINSVPGQGSSFTIFLPLTLAIIDGMLVRVGAARFIIPTLSIRESFRPRPGQVTALHGQGEVVSVRGQLIPMLRLSEKLALEGSLDDPTKGLIVVTQSGSQVYAFFVDELIGKKEVVIKSLGEPFRHMSGLAGAAILGDGQPTLILDPEALGRGLGSATTMPQGA